MLLILLVSVLLGAAGASQSGAKEDSEEVCDLGPGMTPPRLLQRVEPVRPNDARGVRLTGSVVLGLVVTSKGLARDVHIVQSLDKELDQSCIEAVQQWKFEPARKENRPVAVRVTVEIRFRDM
jgi:TonB family protein